MKLCKDCKHFGPIRFTPFDACHHEGAHKEPVSGRAFATFERTSMGNCGEKGKLFEQRVGFFKRIFG
jgi:hypothetical protein